MEKIVKDGLRDCTIILDGSECAVRFDTCFRAFAVRNDSGADVFISKSSGIVPNADGVMCVKSGGSAVFAHNDLDKNAVYLLGTGKVMVHGQQDSNNPFNFAPTFDGGATASGNPVVMDNLQGGVPFSEMVVSGKNLLPVMSNSVTRNGITYTVNSDGTITLNGTAEKADSVDVISKMPINAGIYTLSGCPEGGSGASFSLRAGIGTANTLYGRDYGNGLKITVDSDTVLTVTIQNAEIGRVFDNVVFRPQLEIGTESTEYTPPITGRELTVGVCGKNLLNVYIPTVREYVVNNTTFTINDDGSVTAVSAETETAAARLSLSMTCPPGDYMFSGSANNKFSTYIYNRTKNTVTAWANPNPVPCHIEKENEYVLYFMVRENSKANGDVCKPQLEIGSVATEYEPYHGSTTTITPDSNPYTIPNDIRQVDGLNNISVSEGELSVTGVRKNAAIKKIWDKLDELTTAIIVSNGESE